MSERAGEKIYNTQLEIHRGKLLGKYRKIMLTTDDASKTAVKSTGWQSGHK
jgi:predicted amidohydrolase